MGNLSDYLTVLTPNRNLSEVLVTGNTTGGSNIIITSGDEITNLVADGLTYPIADGTNGQHMVTDGAGALSFISAGTTNTGTDTLTSSASINTDASLGIVFLLTLDHNAILEAPTNLVSGQRYEWLITQGITGGTMTFDSIFDFLGDIPILSLITGVTDKIVTVYDGTSLVAVYSNDASSDAIVIEQDGDVRILAKLTVGGNTEATQTLDILGRTYLENSTEPSTPVSGGVFYVEGGALKFKGSSGTITVIGNP